MDSEKKDYIIKEAEAIIAECVKKAEEGLTGKKISKKNKNIEKRYQKFKSITSAIIIIETVLCIIFATR